MIRDIFEWIVWIPTGIATIISIILIKFISLSMGEDKCRVCWKKPKRAGSDFCSKECWNES